MSNSIGSDPVQRATVQRRLPAVLVVDDEADLRELLSLTLVRLGLDVDTAESVSAARALLAQNKYALCLTDMRLPDGTGLDLVRDVALSAGPPIAVITAYGSAENAVAALKAGAFDYLTKPVDINQLRMLVRSAVREASVPAEDAQPITTLEASALVRLIGDAPAMQQMRKMIGQLARSMAPVAIHGESGSGKELVARAIHDCSSRRAQPFVAVNCGAIPETLMEAEFFGYRKGAFTGAERDREGFFQAAAGGTLFLDEVAELPLPMQVKLLRAIQERRVRKVGASVEEPVDVRLVSATHQDLGALVTSGRFRQDLFYRLNVIELRVPGLRERLDDIPALAESILMRISERASSPRARLSAAATTALKHYRFPGNVRELENILERAVALANDDVLMPDNLMLPISEPDALAGFEPAPLPLVDTLEEATTLSAEEELPDAPPSGVLDFRVVDGVPTSLGAYLDSLERDAIRSALGKTRYNRTAAAQLLGITFRQLRYRMQRLGIK
ncbi:MAG: sigma-54-dependent Fis family transcriptional regulator [Burkholderiaceae bacterium]|nr:sigma-54-dependent Fis family transcriptional regulator [Burkholderiaceae bacterium]